MKKKILPVLFVIVGLVHIVYPTLRDYYFDYQQKKIVAEWQKNLEELSKFSLEDENNNNESDTNTNTNSNSIVTQPELRNEQDNKIKENPAIPQPDLTLEMEGILAIDKINLKVPILTGVTERNLNLAVASIANTGKPGEIGNYGIAGHRSRTYGLQFNRLDELAKGDRLVVETRGTSYTYLVTDSFIVQPEDIQALKNAGQKKTITLVTCDYSSKPYLRLIVQGELQL